MEHEYRYLLSSDEARAFVDVASQHMHLDVHDALRPVAFSQTIYFDTRDRQYWGSELKGHSLRARIRQYASATDIGSAPTLSQYAYLEHKESAGARRRKIRHRLQAETLRRFLAGHALDRDIEDELRNSPPIYELAMRIRKRELHPVVGTWYRRISMSREAVRVTIDENVAFYRPSGDGEIGTPLVLDEPIDMLPGRVVEIKVVGHIPQWLSVAMKTLEGTESVSKFKRGMQIVTSPRRGTINATKPLTALPPTRS